MKNQLEKKLNGFLTLFYETGMPRAYWSFQDSEYIEKNVSQGYCRDCGIYLREQDGPIKVEKVIPFNRKVLEELEKTGNVGEKTSCENGVHKEKIGDNWHFEGLYFLKKGDHLTVYHPKDNKEIWSNIINFNQEGSKFGPDILKEADHLGICRPLWKKYFLNEYPATLITTE